MKKIIFFLPLLLFAVNSFCQASSKYTLSKHYYLQKTKKQKAISLALGVTGPVLFLIGGVMSMSEFGNGLPGGTNYNDSKAKTGDFLMGVGGGITLAAIPFSIASAVNKRKAMRIVLENGTLPKQNALVLKALPALSLKIKFKF